MPASITRFGCTVFPDARLFAGTPSIENRAAMAASFHHPNRLVCLCSVPNQTYMNFFPGAENIPGSAPGEGLMKFFSPAVFFFPWVCKELLAVRPTVPPCPLPSFAIDMPLSVPLLKSSVCLWPSNCSVKNPQSRVSLARCFACRRTSVTFIS